jgi:hypothetical protein
VTLSECEIPSVVPECYEYDVKFDKRLFLCQREIMGSFQQTRKRGFWLKVFLLFKLTINPLLLFFSLVTAWFFASHPYIQQLELP